MFRKNNLNNPGLLVSLVMNISLGLLSVLYLIDVGVIGSFFLNDSIVVGIGLNALLSVSGALLLKRFRKKRQIV